jgi:uncharacterized protein YhjY with autotransporter beta-barrel domain
MKLTMRGRFACTFLSWIGALALLSLAPIAMAQNAPTWGGSIIAPMPAQESSIVINLRQQGVLTGHAPIAVNIFQFEVLLVDGQPNSNLIVSPFDPNPQNFGTVCIRIANDGYTPSEGQLSVVLQGTNTLGTTTNVPGTPVFDAPGPTVNLDDPQQVQACEDGPAPVNQAPTANAGGDRLVNDTDRAAGENVLLNGSASTDPDGTIVSYEWLRVNGEDSESLGTSMSPTLQVRLPDGENVIQLVVTDNSQSSAADTVIITVGAPVSSSGPSANAGADRVIADTDAEDGEDVVLDGSQSVDPDGTIVDYAWSRVNGENTESLGSGQSPTLQTRLPDGQNVIQLVVTDDSGNTASDTVLITVNEVVITSLSNLPGLTPNQKQVAQALDRVCAQLRNRSADEGPQLSANQQDLLTRCDGLQMNNTTANQVSALDEIVADDFAVARTQTLLFANTQYAGVMDRLMALRGGAKGLSLAGLNIIVDGKPVPLAQLQEMAKGLLGGGASADEPGGLLDDKWGLWARGNYSFGEKDRNSQSPAFEAKQWAMVGGVDYRYSDQLVGGVSLAYGQSSIDFDGDTGGLDTDTWAASLYGSSYVAKKFYFDAIVNVANADYGADRNITYVDGTGLVDLDARGDTDGMTYSVGVSGGRDFLMGGLTLSPTLGLFYIDATIDSFTERGAGGLNLIYDEQSFQSFTGNLGFRATYAWNLSWGVLLPHLRVDYIREFKDDVDVFGVRFAADPNAVSTPPILVATDNPDESYWRLATGFSAQFVEGISGYVEYQRLESFEFISFQDVSLGLRFQKSF